jgi:lactose/L-arabinose transport system permease protein
VARPAGLRRYYDVNGWLFVSAALILIAVFMIYPILYSIWMSMHSGKGMALKFAGFYNFARLAKDPVFLTALKNTLVLLVVQVPIMLGLALVLATMLNDATLKFKGLFRTAIFLPCVTSLVASSVLFRSMFAPDGIINEALQAAWIIDQPIPWATDPFWAKMMIVIAVTWRWTGYNMIFYLAALQNIDKSIYEAARIDGINARGRLLYLTIPMLKPVILFTTVTSTIGTLQLFDEVQNIIANPGSPGNATLTLSLYIYQLVFKFMPQYGYAATVSWVIVVLVVLISAVQFFLAREKD